MNLSEPTARDTEYAKVTWILLWLGLFSPVCLSANTNDKDLQSAEPGNVLLSIHGLVVRGSGLFDDLIFMPEIKPSLTTTTETLSDSIPGNDRHVGNVMAQPVSLLNPSIGNSRDSPSKRSITNKIRVLGTLSISSAIPDVKNPLFLSFGLDGLDKSQLRTIRQYEWNFGDGYPAVHTIVPETNHTYIANGQYTVTVTVKGAAGTTTTIVEDVVVTNITDISGVRTLLAETLESHDPAPVIDGDLNESVWQKAAQISGFHLYPWRDMPSDHTEARVLMDSNHVYIAFKCYETELNRINATQTKRDYDFGFDDTVSVQLETFDDIQLASTFSVNSLGTQSDAIMGGRAAKIAWKGDWYAGVKRTDYGWSAEIAIPFTILNYNKDSTEFGVNFWRYQNRTREWSSWVGEAENPEDSTSGKLAGLSLASNIKEKKWTAMPYVLASVNGEDIDGDAKDALGYGGLTLRYEPEPNVTVVADLLPDFTQLETQIDSIDFSYSENFLSDVRPFFQEGSAYFATNSHFFYSRRIPNFYGGLKSFAQVNGSSLSGFVTSSPDERSDGMVRFKDEFSEDHVVELVGVATQQQELQNQVLGANLAGSWNSGLYYDLTYSFSNSQSNQNINGSYTESIIGLELGDFDIGLDGSYYDIGYQPANGLLGNSLPGTQGGFLYAYYLPGRLNDTVTDLNLNASIETRDTLEHVKQREDYYLESTITFRDSTSLFGSYFLSDYRPDIGSPGLFSQVINSDRYFTLGVDFNLESDVFGYGFSASDGKLGGGDYRYLAAYSWLSPTSNIYLGISYAEVTSFGSKDQLTLDAEIEVTPQDNLVAKFNFEEENEYLRLSYKRVVRSGFDLFCVFEKTTDADPRFSVKLIWTL